MGLPRLRDSRSHLLRRRRGVGFRVLAMEYYSGPGVGGIAPAQRGPQVVSEGARGSDDNHSRERQEGLAEDSQVVSVLVVLVDKDVRLSLLRHHLNLRLWLISAGAPPRLASASASTSTDTTFASRHDEPRVRGVLVIEYWRVQAKEGPPRYECGGYGCERTPGVSPSAPLPNADTPAPNVIVHSTRPTKGPATGDGIP